MRFILCAIDRDSGSVTLLSDDSFPTRKQAVDAGAFRASGPVLTDCDLFLVDLDTATPVMVVSGEPPLQDAVRPHVGRFEVPAAEEPASEWVVIAAEPATEPEPRVEYLPPRETEVVIEQWPFVPADDTGGVGPSTLRSDLPDDEEDRAGLWWLETGADAEAAVDTGECPIEPDAPCSLLDSEAPVVDAKSEEDSREDSMTEEPSDARMEADAADGREYAGESEPVDDTFVSFVYRGGPVDLTVWGCPDCVYVSTCPKTATDTPATCGSFQWRPV